MLGASLLRLVEYAWPLFVLGIPIVASRQGGIRWNTGLLLLHLLISWVHFATVGIPALILIALVYALAWRQLAIPR